MGGSPGLWEEVPCFLQVGEISIPFPSWGKEIVVAGDGPVPLPLFLAKDLCPLDLALSITYDNLNKISHLWRKMSRQRT